MKKLLVLMMVFGLILGSIATAEAGKKKKKAPPPEPVKIERTVEFEYVCPCFGLYQLGSLTGGTNLGGGPFAIQAGEVYLTGVTDDMSGQPVGVDINQDLDGDGGNNSVGEFCGETTEPISLTEGLEIRVFVGFPTICAGTPPVGGTITFTLSNMP